MTMTIATINKEHILLFQKIIKAILCYSLICNNNNTISLFFFLFYIVNAIFETAFIKDDDVMLTCRTNNYQVSLYLQ